MNVLAIDTTANRLELALSVQGQVVVHHVGDATSPPSRDLQLVVRSILSGADLTLNALDLIAVVRGPGSFTGLRVGLAAAKTFTRVLGVPAIGLDSLALLAARADQQSDSLLHAAINTYSDEVYLQSFRGQRSSYRPNGGIKLTTFDRLWPLVGRSPLIMRRIPQRNFLPLSCPDETKLLDADLANDLVLEALKAGPRRHEEYDHATITASLTPLYIKADVKPIRVQGLAS